MLVRVHGPQPVRLNRQVTRRHRVIIAQKDSQLAGEALEEKEDEEHVVLLVPGTNLNNFG
jgi:hypothetical protein